MQWIYFQFAFDFIVQSFSVCRIPHKQSECMQSPTDLVKNFEHSANICVDPATSNYLCAMRLRWGAYDLSQELASQLRCRAAPHWQWLSMTNRTWRMRYVFEFDNCCTKRREIIVAKRCMIAFTFMHWFISLSDFSYLSLYVLVWRNFN